MKTILLMLVLNNTLELCDVLCLKGIKCSNVITVFRQLLLLTQTTAKQDPLYSKTYFPSTVLNQLWCQQASFYF